MLGGILTVLHVIGCLILILVILLQAGRGQGLTSPSFGSGNVQSLLGTRAADFLTKATTIAAIAFLFTSLGLNYVETIKSRSLLEGRRAAAPVDIDAVKKALAEAGIKPEDLEQKSTEANQAVSDTQAQVAATAVQADEAVTDAAKMVESSVRIPAEGEAK